MVTDLDTYDVERMIRDRAVRLERYVDDAVAELRRELSDEIAELRRAVRSLEHTLNARTEHLA